MTDSLGKYRILAEIGKGGFATVYRALDTTLDREVALKVLDPILARDPAWVSRFQREAKAIARLKHPHIITIHEIGQSEGRLYIAMELIEGSSLAGRIAERGRLTWDETLAILEQIAGALDYAHGQGVLHRDLKPANIVLDPQRGAILTDFGFARLVGESSMSVSLSGGVVGTPAYIAPEVWDGEEPTAQTDIYSLGCVAYEILTGEVLFAGKTPSVVMRQHLIDGPQWPDAARWPASLPGGVRDVLARTLAKDPAERYPRTGALVAALSALSQPASDRASVAAPSGAPQRRDILTPAPTGVPAPAAARPRPRWLWVAVGVGGVTLFIVLALVIKAAIGGGQATPTPVAVAPTGAAVAVVTIAAPTAPTRAVPAISPSLTPSPVSPLTPTDTVTLSPTATSTTTPSPTSTPAPTATATATPMLAGRVVEIYSDKDWQDTGVVVTKGQFFEIGYLSGKWSECAAYGCPFYDANGATSNLYTDNVMKDCYDARLIGRIAGMAPFCAGNRYFGVADVAGRLELRTNDAAIGDNAGGGRVTLEVNTYRECRALSTWNTTSAPPIPIGHAPAVANNDHIYIIGGAASTGGLRNTAYFASVRNDGELETWQKTTSLPGSADYHASTAANGYLYIAGGSDGVGGSLATVWYAPISSDGTLGGWVSTTALPESLQGLRLVTYQGAIYLTGGSPSAQPRPQTIVYRANVQGDGSLDAWTAVSSLPVATSWHEAVVGKDYLYVIGGATGSGRTPQVYFAAFGPDGELGAWRETTPLPLELANHTAVVIADVIYVAGGLPNADTSQSGGYSAAINADGTLGTWQQVTSLPQGLHDHSAAAVGRSMYIIGGFNTATGEYSDATYTASVQCE